MKASKNQIELGQKVGNFINLLIAFSGGFAVVYGLALYIVKYL